MVPVKHRVRPFCIRSRATLAAAAISLLALMAATGESVVDARDDKSITTAVPQVDATVDAREMLGRACAFLWAQQADDGGWHSGTYAVLRSGQALTPFVLHSLLQVPEDVSPRPPEGVARAAEFLRRHVSADGVLGVADPDLLEYPNYSTAYALRCLLLIGDPGDEALIARMRAYLVSQQFAPDAGFDEAHPAYGGWGFGGPRSSEAPGHMDLAHTRRVLEVLHEAGPVDADVIRRAESFLRYVQRHPSDPRPQPRTVLSEPSGPVPFDGGFYFSPVVLGANKGRIERDTASAASHFRSYATATCDGLLALLASGVAENDPRVTAACVWLRRHSRLDYPEGVPLDHPEPWGAAVRFYHLAVRAEVHRRLAWPGDWRGEIAALLAAEQAADGSCANRYSPLMKEDDPLLCTALAVIALSQALQ